MSRRKPRDTVPVFSFDDADRSFFERARCRGADTDLFMDPTTRGKSIENNAELKARREKALAMCAVCAVKQECLEYAFAIKEFGGVFGGMTGEDRRRLYRRLIRKKRNAEE